jgi:hypothetical protein
LGKGGGLLNVEQEQGEAMFAREFAAGAGAAKGRLAEFDAGLIGLAGAPLALTPNGLFAAAARDPLARHSQLTPGFGRASIGGKGKHLFG